MILSTKKIDCAKWHFLELNIQFGQRLVTLASKTKKKLFHIQSGQKNSFTLLLTPVVGKSFPASYVSSQFPFKKAIFWISQMTAGFSGISDVGS
jgi:hypothetical protein